jgi:hypothetical protein
VGQKLANAALWAGALSCNKKKLESRTQLDEPFECASGGDSLLLYKILHLLFFPLVRIPCALPQFESILDGHLSRHFLPAPFRLEIENTT